MNRREETATELLFGTEELVNTSDATVKRVASEKAAHDRACLRARRQYDAFVASCDAIFVDRVGRILQDVEVELPQLPAQFLENAELSS